MRGKIIYGNIIKNNLTAAGGTIPDKELRSVVFPAPLAPIRVTISPSDNAEKRFSTPAPDHNMYLYSLS